MDRQRGRNRRKQSEDKAESKHEAQIVVLRERASDHTPDRQNARVKTDEEECLTDDHTQVSDDDLEIVGRIMQGSDAQTYHDDDDKGER